MFENGVSGSRLHSPLILALENLDRLGLTFPVDLLVNYDMTRRYGSCAIFRSEINGCRFHQNFTSSKKDQTYSYLTVYLSEIDRKVLG